jgi:hypothetical protein
MNILSKSQNGSMTNTWSSIECVLVKHILDYRDIIEITEIQLILHWNTDYGDKKYALEVLSESIVGNYCC